MHRPSRLLSTLAVAFAAFACGTAFTYAAWRFDGRLKDVAPAPPSALADGRFDCLSYTPYRDGQTPFDANFIVPRAQIEEDLAFLAKHTACIRTYSTDQGLAAAVPIAAKNGLRVLLGAWIGVEASKNDREVKAVIELANAYPQTVAAVVVGNEVLLRGDLTAERLDGYIRQVKAAVPVPVTYADVWEFWLRHPELANDVDFITVHMLPYWEDQPIAVAGALRHVRNILERVRSAFPGHKLFVGEIGWPSLGRMREDARPSPSDQTRFVREFIAVSESFGVGYNFIEAFDQKWKRTSEGTVGGHWGLFDSQHEPKVTLSGPVSDDPFWRPRWLTGTAIGLALLAIALFRRANVARPAWLFANGFLATCAGAGLEAHAVYMLETTQSAFDWAGAIAGFALSALAAALALDVLMDRAAGRGAPERAAADEVLEAVARFRFPRSRRLLVGFVETAVLAFGLAAALALLTDGRYRDFPTFVYLVPAVSFVVLRLAGCAVPPEGERPAYVMAVSLAVVAVATVVNESVRNTQALGWAAAALILASPWLWELVRHAQARAAAIKPNTRPTEANSAS
jgi:glucan 1,3-beta-glucosidase